MRVIMAFNRQGELFGQDGRDLSDDDFETPVYLADPDKVREELHKILAEARAANAMPWDAKRAALCRTIFPQMTNWLPEEEGAVAFRIRIGISAAGSRLIFPSGFRFAQPRLRGYARATSMRAKSSPLNKSFAPCALAQA